MSNLLSISTLSYPQPVMESRVVCMLLFDMDEATFKKYIGMTRRQFETLNRRLSEMGLSEAQGELGRAERFPLERKTGLFLSYMANQHSYRELSDKFDYV